MAEPVPPQDPSAPTPPDGPPTPPLDEPRPTKVEALKTKVEEAQAQVEVAQEEAEKHKADKATLKVQVEDLKALAATPSEAPPRDLQRLHLLQIQPVRDILVFALVLGMFRLGYTLRAVTIPMLLALALAYLVEPVVERVVRRGWMTRTGAAVSVILLILFLIIGPIGAGGSLAVGQGISYSQTVRESIVLVQDYVQEPTPEKAERLRARGKAWRMVGDFLKGVETGAIAPQAQPGATGATGATGSTGSTPSTDGETATPAPTPPPVQTAAAERPRLTAAEAKPGGFLAQSVGGWTSNLLEQNMQSVGRFVARQLLGTGADAFEVSLRVLGAIGYAVFALFLILFFFYFFCTGYERVQATLASLIPKWKKTRALDMLRQMDEVIAGFIRGRLIIMAILMVAFTLGYWLIGVPLAFIIGPIVGILAIIPYAGLVSIPVATALMWFQPSGFEWQQSWWWILLAPAGLYFVIQMIDDYVLTTMIQGKTTQMDTPTILFAVLAGGILAGFYGMILAVPAAACLKILFREAFWPRFRAWAEGRVKDFLPLSRYDPTETAPSSTASAPEGPPTAP